MIKEGFEEEKKWSKEKSQNKKSQEANVVAGAVPRPCAESFPSAPKPMLKKSQRKEGVPLDSATADANDTSEARASVVPKALPTPYLRHRGTEEEKEESQRKACSAEGSVEAKTPAPKPKDKEKRAPKSPPRPSTPAPGKREETRQIRSCRRLCRG